MEQNLFYEDMYKEKNLYMFFLIVAIGWMITSILDYFHISLNPYQIFEEISFFSFVMSMLVYSGTITIIFIAWLKARKYYLHITDEKMIVNTFQKKIVINISEISYYLLVRHIIPLRSKLITVITKDKRVIIIKTKRKDELEEIFKKYGIYKFYINTIEKIQ